MAEASAISSPDAEKDEEKPVTMEKPAQPIRYTKTPGGANMAGELYEMKLAALLFIRCLIAGRPFKIATNMKAAGSFDDIVMGLNGQMPILLQLKHRTGQSKLVYDNQFTQLKGDFALLRYCETFCTLKKQWHNDLVHCGNFEKCVFVLYTNARVVCLRKPINKQNKNCKAKEQLNNAEPANTWQSMLNTGGNFGPVLRESHPKLYEVFENVPEYKRILRERTNAEDVLKAVRALANKDAKEVPPDNELDVLSAEIEKLNSIDCYEEFLTRLWIFGSQASEQKLNFLIETDLKKLLGIKCSKNITNTLLDGIQRWWQYDNRYLNEDNKLWQEILESRWEMLSSNVMSKLNKLTIEFQEQEIAALKQELSKNKTIVHILATDSPILSCLKVIESLKDSKRIIVDRETFEGNQGEIMAYSKHNIALILFCEDEGFEAFMKYVNAAEMEGGHWRVIIVSRYKNHFETIQDTCNASHLQEKSRELLLVKRVNFQGQEVPFNSIFGQYEKLLSVISGETILEVLSDSKMLSIGNAPKSIIEYFISRTLQRKDAISNAVLKENAIFAITGTDDTQKIIPKDKNVMQFKSGDPVEQSCTIFKIRNVADFEELAKIFKSIHWLHENDGSFHWVQSKGNIQIIKKYIARAQAASSCNNILSLSERFILLIAEPGMGKSTLMSYIALEMKKLKPSSWVIKVNLNDYGEYLNENNPSPLGLLEKAVNITSDFQRNLLQLCLDVTGNITVLLDGFDEISPYYADQTISVVQKLVRDTKIEQIWVTSRPIMKEKLEETFSTLSYALKPFSEVDQTAFLRKFWNFEDIEEFAKNLLEFTRRWLNDKIGQFTGIPLQTMMLAEAFREDMLHFRKTGKNSLPERLDLLQLYEKFIDTKLKIYFQEKLMLDVYNAGVKATSETIQHEFYEKHMICAILSLFSQEEFSKLPSSENLKERVEYFLLSVQEGKERTGIIVSFNNEKPTFIHRTFAEYFLAMWLVENYSNYPELVEHLLFSPTFEIMWTFFDRAITRDCILHEAVLNEDKHKVRMLATSNPALLKAVDRGGRTVLHLAVLNYGSRTGDKDVKDTRFEIFEMLLTYQKENLSVCDNILCWTPLKYADKVHAWQVVNLLLQEGADEKEMEFTCSQLKDEVFLRKTLRQVLMKGYIKVIKYLINCKQDVVNSTFFVEMEYMDKTSHVWVAPLHEASFRGHRDIAELLVESKADLEAQDDTFGETPLLWAAKASQWDIVDLLISKGANIKAISIETEANIIHFVARTNNIELLHFLVRDEHLVAHVNAHTLKHNSPVWEAARIHKWANVRLLLEKGVSLHCYIAPKGYSLLHYAAKTADNDTLCLLLDYSDLVKQINAENDLGEAPIEFAAKAGKWDLVRTFLKHGAICTKSVVYKAASLGSVEIMEELITIPGVSEVLVSTNPSQKSLLLLASNSEQWDMFTFLIKQGLSLPDNSGTTVLHLAVNSNDPELLDFVLEHSGLDVDALNGDQETAFMCAARQANLYALEHLADRGADPLIVHPTGGYTALHLAAECDKGFVVTFLLENTELLDDINRIDCKGSTALMRALPRKHGLAVSRCLLQFGAQCNHLYENGETLMHGAARSGKIELGELFVQRGVSPFQRNHKGISPLHVAAYKGKVAFVEWLLSQGAEANEIDDEERTPLLWAIGRNCQNYVEVAKLLLQYGADPNQPTKSGKTPLHLAAFSQDMVEVLLKWDANPTISDLEGKTPLHYAAYFDTYPAVELLVKHGADPNKKDICGKTAYDIALEARSVVKTRTKKRSTALNYLEKVTTVSS